MWFKATVPGVIVDETTSGWHDSWIEVLAGGTLKVSVWNCSAVTVGTVSFGAWNHVVLTYAAGSLGGALNGVTATPNVCTRSTPGGGTLYYALGLADGTNMGSGAYFTGAMDDVRIYTRALGAAEVTQLYTAAKARLR